MNKEFGDFITTRANELDLSLRELCEAMHEPNAEKVIKLMWGQRVIPSYRALEGLAQVLQVPMEELLKRMDTNGIYNNRNSNMDNH